MLLHGPSRRDPIILLVQLLRQLLLNQLVALHRFDLMPSLMVKPLQLLVNVVKLLLKVQAIAIVCRQLVRDLLQASAGFAMTPVKGLLLVNVGRLRHNVNRTIDGLSHVSREVDKHLLHSRQ